jgi:hypothetical protein
MTITAHLADPRPGGLLGGSPPHSTVGTIFRNHFRRFRSAALDPASELVQEGFPSKTGRLAVHVAMLTGFGATGGATCLRG